MKRRSFLVLLACILTTQAVIVMAAPPQQSPTQPSSSVPKQPMTVPLKVVSPNGGEVFHKGFPVTISWTGGRPTKGYGIHVSTDAGKTWSVISEEYDAKKMPTEETGGTYEWMVDAAFSDNCFIKVSLYDEAGNAQEDQNDKPFKIGGDLMMPDKNVKPSATPATDDLTQPGSTDPKQPLTPKNTITVLAPNGDEKVTQGTPLEIKWQGSNLADGFAVHVSTNNGKTWIIVKERFAHLDDVQNSYLWTVDAKPALQCLIKVTEYDQNGDTHEDVSDKPFQISAMRKQSNSLDK